jgi:hypothetical protein
VDSGQAISGMAISNDGVECDLLELIAFGQLGKRCINYEKFKLFLGLNIFELNLKCRYRWRLRGGVAIRGRSMPAAGTAREGASLGDRGGFLPPPPPRNFPHYCESDSNAF